MRHWVYPLLLVGCSAGAPLPAPALALNRAGIEALSRGDLETADARFSVALEYSPRFVDALVNLGLVELERGNFARASVLFERARRLNPDVAQPHHALGVLAEREHRPDRASRHYYDALRVDPGFAPSRNNLARLLFQAGDLQEALIQYQRLREIAPHDSVAAAGLVETLCRLGRVREADAVLAPALAEHPRDPRLVLLIARAELRARDIERAVARLAPLATRSDDFGAAALAWLGVAELMQHHPQAALARAARSLSLDLEQEVATVVLAVAATELGAPEAPRWLARARQIAPHDPLLARLARTML